MADLPSPDTATPPAPRRHGRALLPAALLAALLGWLGGTTSGLERLARLAEYATGQHLQIAVADGRLFGAIALRRLQWQDADLRVTLDGVRLAWRPARLLAGEFAARSLAVERLDYRSLSTTPATTPASLALPLRLNAADIRLGSLSFGDAAATHTFAHQLAAAHFTVTADAYRLDGFSAHLALGDGPALAQGSGRIAVAPPFASTLQLAVTGQAQGHPLQLDLAADGPLGALPVQGRLQLGPGQASLHALIHSFAGQPLGALELASQALDPGALWPGTPHARVDLTLHLAADADGALAGSLRADNTAPAPIDKDGLPLAALGARLRWQDGGLQLADVDARLSGDGRLTGKGRYADGRLQLDLLAHALDARSIDGRTRHTRLDGPLQLQLAADAQALDARLRDNRFTIDAALAHRHGQVQVARLHLAAGAARLDLAGHLDLGAPRRFALAGTLQDFDPARFLATAPAARLNAAFSGSGRLDAPRRASLQLALHDSRLAGQPLSGSARGELDGDTLRALSLALRLGPNRLDASGAFGAPGQRLAFRVDAPHLVAGPLQGSLQGQGSLAGTPAHPALQAELRSPALQLPGDIALQGLQLQASLPANPAAPLQLDLTLAQLGRSTGTPWLRQLQLQAGGSAASHHIDTSAALPGVAQHLALRLEGGLQSAANAPLRWRGQLAALRLTPDQGNTPLLVLAAPAPLQLASDIQSLGPLQLQGQDWLLAVDQLEHRRDGILTRGRLQGLPLARLQLPGVDGDLRLDGEWSVDWHDAPGGSFQLQRASGDLVLLQGDTRLPLGLQALNLQGRLQPGALALDARAQGSRLGSADATLRLPLATDGSLARDASLAGSAHLALQQLDWLAPLLRPDLQLAGRLDARLQLAGTLARPALTGDLAGSALDLTLLSSGMRLARGRLQARLQDSRLELQSLHFDAPLAPLPAPLGSLPAALRGTLSQPGSVHASGRLDLLDESGELDLHLAHVGALQQPRQWLALSGDVRLGLARRRLQVRGALGVDAASWTLADLGRPELSDDVVIHRGPAPRPAERPLAIDVDLAADLGDHVHFSGAGLTTRLAGTLRLQAEGLANLRATGTIRSEDGRFSAYGQDLQVQRGLVNFQGLLDNPGLNIRAVRPGLAVEAGVEVGGTARAPVVRLVSSPEVPDADKLSWMLLGHGAAQTSGGEQSLLVNAAGAILGERSGAGGVVEKLKQGFGLDEVSVAQGSVGGQSTLPTSQVATAQGFSSSTTGSNGQIVSLGKRLGKDLYLSFEQSLNATESIVKLTLQLSRHLAVVGRAGSDNAVDATYTLRFGK